METEQTFRKDKDNNGPEKSDEDGEEEEDEDDDDDDDDKGNGKGLLGAIKPLEDSIFRNPRLPSSIPKGFCRFIKGCHP